MEGNRDLYWKINQTTKKLMVVNINELSNDKSMLMFEIVHPMIDTFDVYPPGCSCTHNH